MIIITDEKEFIRILKYLHKTSIEREHRNSYQSKVDSERAEDLHATHFAAEWMARLDVNPFEKADLDWLHTSKKVDQPHD